MVLTHRQGVERFGSNYLLSKAVAEGALYKIEKGVYSDKKNVSDIAIVAAKYPQAVFTMNSAFYHYGLTDVIPDKCYLVTGRGAKKITDCRVVQRFENSDILHFGAIEVDYGGVKVVMYNQERMLLELLRNKNSLPFDYYKEILLNFRRKTQSLDLQTIQDYIQEYPKAAMIEQALQLEVF